MRELPSLWRRYVDLDHSGDVRLAELPVLAKEDFGAAVLDISRRARASKHSVVVLGSGGTTARPKLSFIPTDQLIHEISAEWQPLRSDDVLVNYDTPGRLSSSHNFFHALAAHAGAVILPLGAVPDGEMDGWLELVDRVRPNVLNATGGQAAKFLQNWQRARSERPPFRALLWTGEAFGATALRTVRSLCPNIELHGVYGSTETWVVGANGPACDIDTFHLMPYQHIELIDGLVHVTNLHPKSVNPVVRYRIGDRGAFVTCPCGRRDRALRVMGREDPQVKFLSVLVAPSDVVGAARTVQGVSDVQLILSRHGSPGEHMEILILSDGAQASSVVDDVRVAVLHQVYRVGYEVSTEAPDAVSVRVVDRLRIDTRSGKTPLLVFDELIEH